jgi:mannose-6-phosphate isomerase-like protein (cupin superfamily)
MIENITHQGILMAVIIRSSYRQEGIHFFTPENFSQQLGYMNRPKGYTIAPHIHRHLERRVLFTQEVLVVKSGNVRVDFYTVDQAYIESRVISKGDVILLAAAGHGFEFLDDAELIEIKQGPYSSADDKIRFTGANRSKAMMEK